ncbi:TonB-dependent receptor [Dokdonella sp.]|uniref:TonB-dependent receptor n=1 Tax=Dokdonella sp. TaxID=2291710 RepID=UPI002F41575B
MLQNLTRGAFAAALSIAASAAVPALALAEESRGGRADREDAEDREREGGARRRDATDAWQGETVRVTAKGTAADVPDALATDVVRWSDAIAAPVDVQDLLTRVPGVGATGQNGLFETFSIRGSGANGILVLLGGMPLTAQRRAGVPVSFVEPALLGDIAVTRGPAVVHYGPGALGGAISIEPRWFDAAFVEAGYATAGDEANLVAGLGADAFSLGVARHQSGDSRSPGDVPLNTSYRRESASLQYRDRFGAFDVDALLLPSRTEDIGKSNSRYPTRDSTYPEDSHMLGRVRVRHDDGFEASAYAHDQYLGTWNRRPGSPDTFAGVRSLDAGTTVQWMFEAGAFSHDIGIEYFGRRDVTAYDATGSLLERDYSLRNAKEDAWSLFAASDWRVSNALLLEFGARRTSIEQRQRGAGADDADHAFTAGAAWSPGHGHRITFNASTGYRFATLEERYYSGVTAQGEIVGNPDLGSERSRGLDLGYAWHGGAWNVEAHAWRTVVAGLIQLTELAPDVNGYGNVGEGSLHGAEIAFAWTSPAPGLELRASATVVRGHDEHGRPLYGVPPLTAELEARYARDRWSIGARYGHRWKMDRPGFEEVARDAVDVIDADVRWRLRDGLSLQFYLRNAFDEDYYATADALSTFAQERSIGVDVVWTMH